jgi:Xaa-Pro aminopeptidase
MTVAHDIRSAGADAPPPDATEARGPLSAERIALLQRLVAERGAGGLLLGSRRNIAWLTVGAATHILQSTDEAVASVLVTPERAVILTQNIEADRIATEELDGVDVAVEPYDWFADGGADAVARAMVSGTILGDDDIETALQPVRSVLAPIEQQRMAWIGARVHEALEQALEGVEQDEPEDFLAADATMILGDAGVRAPVVLVAADHRIARFRTRCRVASASASA